MSRTSNTICKILFMALLSAFILVIIPGMKSKADIEDPVVFEVSFDGAQSWDEYEVYYAYKPEVVTPGTITYTKVEGEFTGDDFTDGKSDGYFADRGDGWALYGARFSFENITTMSTIDDGDEIYIRIVTKKVDSKPAKKIMYGNARDPYWYFEEKSIFGDDRDYNYSIVPGEMSQDSCTYEIKANLGDFMTYSALNFGLAYPRQGDIRAIDYIEGDIFAYGDLDGNGSVDATDIKRGIAVDLCRKYFWEEGGILTEYYEISHPNDILEGKKLYLDENRLTVTSNDTVSAYDKNGNTESITSYTYSLELGYSPDGTLVTASGVAYGLDSTEIVLIQAGNTLYIRDVVRDNTEFPDDEVAFGNYGETPAVCVVVNDFNSVKFGGNGAATNYDRTYNPDGSTVLCVFMQNEDFANKYNDTFEAGGTQFSTWPSERSSNLRIIGANNRYVIVEPYANSMRAEGLQKDPVCMTGDNAYVETFAGYKELKITSLSSQLGCTASQQIKDIKLVDRSMSKGVRITPINDEESHVGFKVTFKSNFYDEVPIEITYEDDVTQTLTIKRIALVVRYVYLADPTVPGNENADFCYDFGITDSKVAYNYGAGEQIIIYAQYYHTDDANTDLSLFLTKEDGSTQVINKDTVGRANGVYTKAATEDCVAETYFLLGFTPAHYEWGESIDNQNVGAWDAMVLNAGYNGSNSFGGAQFGSGTGFHWDGQISWQY